MMQQADRHLELEIEVDGDGGVKIGPEHLRQLGVPSGSKLHVRLTARQPGTLPARGGITEEEIDRISRMQLEDRESVIVFLSAEGRLAGNRAFRRRAKGLVR
jgi:hypothetical protein